MATQTLGVIGTTGNCIELEGQRPLDIKDSQCERMEQEDPSSTRATHDDS